MSRGRANGREEGEISNENLFLFLLGILFKDQTIDNAISTRAATRARRAASHNHFIPTDCPDALNGCYLQKLITQNWETKEGSDQLKQQKSILTSNITSLMEWINTIAKKVHYQPTASRRTRADEQRCCRPCQKMFLSRCSQTSVPDAPSLA